MSYQVLARKWRPQTFADVVGQQHVLSAIANGLTLGRIHHAYLFSGTRGVGKTTIARLLAKGLNCEKGVTATPCGECQNCKEIEEGRFIDLIEIDAASRTKVEDTRELLDNVQYAPAKGRYKVYLIDEVHMLSRHSFNALLKTLEEPPAHVKFLLATTDPQKLPVTILSRCLQFHLQALDKGQIAQQLDKILTTEKIPFDNKAIELLAKSADGSMRDALSLTDQAIATGNGEVMLESVRAMLGTLDDEQPLRLLEALAKGDGSAVMAVIADLAQQGIDWDMLLSDCLTQLHQAAMNQLLPKGETASADSRITLLAKAISPQDLQLYYQFMLTGRKELALAPDRRSGVEMTFLRALAFHPKKQLAGRATTQPSQTQIESKHAQTPAKSQPQTIEYRRDDKAPTESPKQASSLMHNVPETSPLAQLLAERHQLQKTSQHLENQEQENASYSPRKPSVAIETNKTKTDKHVSPLERLVSVVDKHQQEIQRHITPPVEKRKEAYRWKAQNPEKQEEVQVVTPKHVRSALEHEKTPELAAKLAEEAQQRDPWAQEISQLTIPKLVQQLALNAFKEEKSANEVCLHLRNEQHHLNTEGAREALAGALSQLAGHDITVSIVIDDNRNEKTPLEWRELIYEEKLAQAQTSVKDDEHIQMICRYFDAQLDEESIRPV